MKCYERQWDMHWTTTGDNQGRHSDFEKKMMAIFGMGGARSWYSYWWPEFVSDRNEAAWDYSFTNNITEEDNTAWCQDHGYNAVCSFDEQSCPVRWYIAHHARAFLYRRSQAIVNIPMVQVG